MDGKLKIIIPAIIILALGGIAFTMMGSPESAVHKATEGIPTPQTTGNTPPPADTPPPQGTGNIDEIVQASIQAAADEEGALSDEEGDAALVQSESDVVAEFGQSVNDNDF